MKIVYVANDGTTFETKEECMYYERIFRSQGKDDIISGLDEDGNIIKLSELGDNFYDRVFVVKLNDYDAVDYFKEGSLIGGFSVDGITEPATYVWSDFINEYDPIWIPIKDIIEEHQRIIDRMEECKKKLGL